jgi:dTDP-4-dehydrorhamnose 3,5-epimerase-like enzyme
MVLDVRSDSPTFGQLKTVELGSNETVSHGIYVPKGFAHGFITLSESATVVYVQSGVHSPEHDTGVAIESVRSMIPSNVLFDFELLSDRDKSLPNLDEFPRYSEIEWENQR